MPRAAPGTRSGSSICRSRTTPTISAWSRSWRPDVVAFSCNYLANVPEIVDLAKATKALPSGTCFICVGGHSASFTASAILEHGEGAIDCVLKGEGEAAHAAAARSDRGDRDGRSPRCPARSPRGRGPAAGFCRIHSTTCGRRAISLRHRRKYFIGTLDPCASIEFSRGCPWDCSFCSAWTFYGRSYRLISPERVVEDLRVDPRARRLHRRRCGLRPRAARHGDRRGDRPRGHPQALLPGNPRRRAAAQQGGVPLLEDGSGSSTCSSASRRSTRRACRKYRKRVPLGRNFEALEFARSLGINVAINLIADPDWDHERFRDRARLVPGDAGRRQHQRQHALSGHRELAHRAAPAGRPAIIACSTSSMRCCRPSCRLRQFYRELSAHPAGALPQAYELADRAAAWRALAGISRADRPISCAES